MLRKEFLSALLFLGAPLAAQTVLVVDDDGGPGVDYTQIQSAVEAAAPGTTILVRAGNYSRVVINARDLVVTGEPGSPVVVAEVIVRNLTPSQTVTLRELEIRGNQPVVLLGNQGVVWMEKCSALEDGISHPILPAAAIHIVNSNHVVIRDSIGRGGFTADLGHRVVHGLIVDRSSVYLYDSGFFGVNGTCTHFGFIFPGAGGIVFDSFLYASDSLFIGGSIDSQDFCSETPSGDGLVVTGTTGSTVHLVNGLAQAGFSDVVFGQDIFEHMGTVSVRTDPVRELEITSPVRSDETVGITVRGVLGDQILVIYGMNPSTFYLPLFFDGLHLPLPVSSFFAGNVDALGELNLNIPPQLPAGFEAMTVYVQAIAFNPLDVEPTFDFLEPTSVVVVDEAF